MTSVRQKRVLVVAALVFPVLFAPMFPAVAQAPLFGETLTLTASPRTPQPGGSVSIRAESFAIDLNRSVLTWTVNGKTVARERGKTDLETTVGKSGTALIISASAEAPGGAVIEGTLVVRPAALELMFEADSYTPPFYRGKALPGPDASLTFLAIPHLVDESGKEIPAGNLVYTWRQDGKVLGDFSGYGKRSLTVKSGAFGRPSRVSVEAAASGGLSAEGSVVVSPTAPLVRIYEADPLRGIRFERSLEGTVSMTGKEITLAAYPFFFSVKNMRDASASFTWTIDGNRVENPSPARHTLTLRQTAEGRGSADVAVAVANAEELLQSARRSIGIAFGE